MNRWGTVLLAAALAALTFSTGCTGGPTSAAQVGDSIITLCDADLRNVHPHTTWETRHYGGTGFYEPFTGTPDRPGFYDGFLWTDDDVYVSIGFNDAVMWSEPDTYNQPVDPVDYYNRVQDLVNRTTGQVWWTNIRMAHFTDPTSNDYLRAKTINNVLALADFNNARLHVIDYDTQGEPDWYNPAYDDVHPTPGDGCVKWASMYP
jgi:hypothetical protein